MTISVSSALVTPHSAAVLDMDDDINPYESPQPTSTAPPIWRVVLDVMDRGGTTLFACLMVGVATLLVGGTLISASIPAAFGWDLRLRDFFLVTLAPLLVPLGGIAAGYFACVSPNWRKTVHRQLMISGLVIVAFLLIGFVYLLYEESQGG